MLSFVERSIGVEVSTLLDRTTCSEHELEPTVKHNFIAIDESRKNRNPATVIHS
jgi:hypothetical protein